jgi:hypothetical protein
MSTPLQTKMFSLARADATLQGYLLGANGTFRWLPIQLQKGYIAQGSVVVVRQISSILPYSLSGPMSLDWVMMQLDCYDLNSLRAQALANYLILSWFPASNFAVDNQFTSPPTAAPPAMNVKLSQRNSLASVEAQPQTAYVETLTYRVCNNVNT